MEETHFRASCQYPSRISFCHSVGWLLGEGVLTVSPLSAHRPKKHQQESQLTQRSHENILTDKRAFLTFYEFC